MGLLPRPCEGSVFVLRFFCSWHSFHSSDGIVYVKVHGRSELVLLHFVVQASLSGVTG